MKKPKTLEETHKTGFSGLWSIYDKKKLFYSLITPLAFSILFTILLSLTSKNLYLTINEVITLVLSIVPNLLGFLLGGYALIVGFGNERFLQSLTKQVKGDSITYYQKFSSVFAFTIYSLSISLIIGIIFSFCLKVPAPLCIPASFILSINVTALFILLFFLIYSGFLLPTMVMNIFDFSQIHHIKLYSARMNEEKEEKKPEH